MHLPFDVLGQILAMPAAERYELANCILDSIDDQAVDLDDAMREDMRQRREEMLYGQSFFHNAHEC